MNLSTPPPSADTSHFRRPPEAVMRLARLGSAHPTRLSFLRVLMRRMRAERWRFDRPLWQVDEKGTGRAVYRAIGPDRAYSLVAFAHDLPDSMRSDRVIASAWDATFVLFDGTPDAADLVRLGRNVPKQEAGRLGPSELSLSRANRSVRLFGHVVDRLSNGRQPDVEEIRKVGYLMRTTAVYGSGKFGMADRTQLAGRPEIKAPFQVEMLTVWLIRAFTVDIAEHLAHVRGGAHAARLDPANRRSLGVGNSTGLGMAPFLIRHPVLLNNWMMAREEALARVRALQFAPADSLSLFDAHLAEGHANARAWHSAHPLQQAKRADLRTDLDRIRLKRHLWPAGEQRPWDALWRWGETHLTLEGQEQLLSLMLEPHGPLVDDLSDRMDSDEDGALPIDGTMSVATLRTILRRHYDWALGIDFDDPQACARFWYVSEEKLEPRLGERFAEDGAACELPLCVARMARDMHRTLEHRQDEEPIAGFLLLHPEHRMMVRRAQMAARYPFAEIRDNLIAHDMLPIDLLRCKLSFFGATRFDPRSDRWVRISLFQDAPYPDEMDAETAI